MQEHCCGADKLFNLKEAKRERKRYLRRGAKSSTAAIIKRLSKDLQRDSTLLDIGGGIGILGMELQKRGVVQYTSVDASTGYQKIAREMLSEKEGWQANFINGDFVEEAPGLEPHDLVTLDKVICCYPQMEELLISAAGKCRDRIAISFPPSGPLSRLFRSLANLYLRINGNPFRTYIHPENKVHQVLKNEGLAPVYRGLHFPWRVEIWQRPAEA